MDHESAIRDRATEKYLLGELAPEARDDFEEHFFSCSVCAEDVKLAAGFIDTSKKILAERNFVSSPAGDRSGGGLWSWFRIPSFAPYALTAVFAGLVVYQSLVTIPELRELGEPQVVTNTTVVPETRGNPTVLRASPNSRWVQFSIDVNDAAALSSQTGTFKNAAGEKVFAVELPAAPSGSISFLLPLDRFPAGQYTLELGNFGGGVPPNNVEKYRFEVGR
jgi:hypothetical protein